MDQNDTRLKELQQVEARLLADFRDICEENNLNYFLSDGTLLGAIRHQGFIPWDDDIDVTMPYEDYLAFVSIIQRDYSNKFFLQNSSTVPYFYKAFGQMQIKNTTLLSSYNISYDIHHGVFLDIFPLIQINGGIELLFKKWIIRLSNYLQMDSNISSHYDEFEQKFGKPILGLLSVIYKIPIQKRQALHSRIIHFVLKKKKNKRNYAIVEGGISHIYPKQVFARRTQVSFEGEQFLAPYDYDTYLRIMYGDYMTLPPIEERYGHGNDYIIDFDKNYTEYMDL